MLKSVAGFVAQKQNRHLPTIWTLVVVEVELLSWEWRQRLLLSSSLIHVVAGEFEGVGETVVVVAPTTRNGRPFVLASTFVSFHAKDVEAKDEWMNTVRLLRSRVRSF